MCLLLPVFSLQVVGVVHKAVVIDSQGVEFAPPFRNLLFAALVFLVGFGKLSFQEGGIGVVGRGLGLAGDDGRLCFLELTFQTLVFILRELLVIVSIYQSLSGVTHF